MLSSRTSTVIKAVVAVSALLVAGVAIADTDVRQSFDIVVPRAPAPTRVGSQDLLVYELHLTNFASRPLTIARIEVREASEGRVLLQLDGRALETATGRPGAVATNKLTLAPGERAIVYIEAPIVMGTVVEVVHNRVEYAPDGEIAASPSLVENRIAVDRRALPVLTPPLRGGPWVAVYDPSLERGHRRVIYAVGGRAAIPGRFAVDWMRPGLEQGGSGESGAGEDVLAVADGIVVAVRADVPEPPSNVPRPRVRLADAPGNYVAIDIGSGRYAFYEHLLPGSQIVRGQRVRRGQVIGRLGSTRSASRPHLHFHLADANSPLDAEGIPYRLANARILASYPSITAFEAAAPWQPAVSVGEAPSFPQPNVIVMFGDRK